MWFVMESAQTSYRLSEYLLDVLNTPTWSAAKAERVVALIGDGADVNAAYGQLLPLHCACTTADAAVVSLLIDCGARVDAVDGFGRRALHYAAERSDESVRLLLDGGATADAPDAHGNTPLHWAAYKNRHECVRLLLEHGADADALDANGDSALSWAALKGHLEAVSVLLAFNCRPDTRNLSGGSPLTRLAQTVAQGIGSPQDECCLRLLLAAIVQVDLRCERTGRLPPLLDGAGEISELLFDHCANPRPLRQHCRCVIRRALGVGYLRSRVDRLDIPPAIRDYLLIV